jgi:cell division protease FtsH
MDQEIRNLIIEAESRAEAVIKENREKLNELADALLKEETLEKSAVDGILGERAKQEEKRGG